MLEVRRYSKEIEPLGLSGKSLSSPGDQLNVDEKRKWAGESKTSSGLSARLSEGYSEEPGKQIIRTAYTKQAGTSKGLLPDGMFLNTSWNMKTSFIFLYS